MLKLELIKRGKGQLRINIMGKMKKMITIVTYQRKVPSLENGEKIYVFLLDKARSMVTITE